MKSALRLNSRRGSAVNDAEDLKKNTRRGSNTNDTGSSSGMFGRRGSSANDAADLKNSRRGSNADGASSHGLFGHSRRGSNANEAADSKRRGSSDGSSHKLLGRRGSNTNDAADLKKASSSKLLSRRGSNTNGSGSNRRLSNDGSSDGDDSSPPKRRYSSRTSGSHDSGDDLPTSSKDVAPDSPQQNRRGGLKGEPSKGAKASEALARRRGGRPNLARTRPSDGGHMKGDANIHDRLPPEYRYNPKMAAPVLHYLPRLMAAVAARATQEHVQLQQLLKAAQGDIRSHRARIQAGLERDMKLIWTYQLDHDPRFKERCN
jgi:hypothetical protein